ncbi:GNAT family N-acetyltransferase [Alkalicoccobacillus murimartini]|uniref:GNAT superfamily N-acetyltransferase n=1 Tax=Alkalicoccobacillus murimartini TaxID=171685 RepID=A0ABT9YLL1_9BACI|nr:GNAT family N-acetyltransferase [Alkalicoccobacillus murimartini]MDQ0208765.1 GNAT superfamily N-acetyltransferase [Alkalicoccobacillus murimartini]
MIRDAELVDSHSVATLCLQMGYQLDEKIATERLSMLIKAKSDGIFVYQSTEGKILGWAHVLGKHLIELEYAEIGGLVVDSQERRKGIGQQLMKKCEEWARKHGYSEIRLRSGGQRKEAHQFYNQIGYENINWQQVFRKKIGG